ncbi:hypothetical protein pipiens_019057 [Culex pipiens pipiens]|uniref:Uncharacterized protein n=1 Tax=Culex pipiens pipiens TaxID=38569 RepID=A0ABD1DWJ6_CULPP
MPEVDPVDVDIRKQDEVRWKFRIGTASIGRLILSGPMNDDWDNRGMRNNSGVGGGYNSIPPSFVSDGYGAVQTIFNLNAVRWLANQQQRDQHRDHNDHPRKLSTAAALFQDEELQRIEAIIKEKGLAKDDDFDCNQKLQFVGTEPAEGYAATN